MGTVASSEKIKCVCGEEAKYRCSAHENIFRLLPYLEKFKRHQKETIVGLVVCENCAKNHENMFTYLPNGWTEENPLDYEPMRY